MPNTINTKLDDTNFPIIHITFGNTIKDDAEFEQIKNFWMKLYTHEKYFYMIFDTSNMNTLPISYIYKLSKFATQLKKLEIQYMKASILIIKSDFVRGLYSFDVNIILNKLLKNEKIVGYVEYSP